MDLHAGQSIAWGNGLAVSTDTGESSVAVTITPGWPVELQFINAGQAWTYRGTVSNEATNVIQVAKGQTLTITVYQTSTFYWTSTSATTVSVIPLRFAPTFAH